MSSSARTSSHVVGRCHRGARRRARIGLEPSGAASRTVGDSPRFGPEHGGGGHRMREPTLGPGLPRIVARAFGLVVWLTLAVVPATVAGQPRDSDGYPVRVEDA